MLHLTATEPNPFRRGRAYGEGLAARLPTVWTSYRHLFSVLAGVTERDALRFGAETLRLAGDWSPAVARELEGVAAGSGLSPEAIGALNARTELVVAAECATVGRVRSPDGPWLAQNWDWLLDAPERCVVVTGPAHVTFTEAGILAKVGVNSAGLALSLDMLRHRSDTRRPTATPIHILLHHVLTTCATVDDVAAVLDDADPVASSCFTVVTADGDGACFEVTPERVVRLPADADGFLYHTNHLLDPTLASGDGFAPLLGESCSRQAVLAASRPETISDARRVLADHSSTPLPLCRHQDAVVPGMPASGTAAYVAMDPVRGTLDVGAGPTCRAVTDRFTVPTPVATTTRGT